MEKLMSIISHIGRRRATRDCARSYDVAEQWLATYRVSHNPRHLDTARICFVIADELYSQSVDKAWDGDKALMQQIRSQNRKQVIEAFAALGHAPYVADSRDLAAAPEEESPNPNR
jgi:hypothetical protein